MSSSEKKAKKSGKKMAADILRMIATQDPEQIRRGWLAMISKWQSGDVASGVLVVNYLDGKPHQSVDMEVEVSGDNIRTIDDAEVIKTLRDRMAGIIPKRTSASVESGGSEGEGGDKKPH